MNHRKLPATGGRDGRLHSTDKRGVKTVLLVDDFEPLLNAWEKEFKREHKDVLKATDRATALQLAQEGRPQVAIVDLFLGLGESGIDVVRDLKALDPDMFAVLISGNMSVAYAMEGVRAGADDVFVKAIQARQVLQRVENGVPLTTTPDTDMSLVQSEWEQITRALIDSNHNVTEAAQRLGIYRQTLQRKLRKRLGSRRRLPKG